MNSTSGLQNVFITYISHLSIVLRYVNVKMEILTVIVITVKEV